VPQVGVWRRHPVIQTSLDPENKGSIRKREREKRCKREKR